MKSLSIFRRQGARVPEVNSSYPQKIQDRAKKLNDRVVALEERHQSVGEHRKRFAKKLDNMDSEDDAKTFETKPGVVISNDESFESANLRDLDFNLLREERILRKDLDEFIGDWRKATYDILAKARTTLEETRKEIHDGLIAFGFLDPEVHKLSMSRVLPGYVFSHPKVVEAGTEIKRLETLYSSSIQADNREALQEVEEAIILEKRRLLNVEQNIAVA